MASEPGRSRFFFVLKAAGAGAYDTEFGAAEHRDYGDAPHCRHCGAVLGMLVWLPPFRGELKLHGEGFGDFATGPGNSLVISERFADLFRAEGLTGFSGFHPIEIIGVRTRRKRLKLAAPPRYLLVVPAMGSAAVAEQRSRIRRSRLIACDVCRATGVDAVHGFTIDAESWNGDDVFHARGLWGTDVVSERFERFIARHGLTNMRLTPSEDYRWDPLALEAGR